MGFWKDIFAGIGRKFSKLGQALGELVWYIICCCYITWWNVSENTRSILALTLWGVLIPASSLFVVEGLGTFFGDRLDSVPLPIWLKVVITIGGLFMVIHRLLEWQELWKESRFADVVALLVEQCAALTLPKEIEQRAEVVYEFIPTILSAFVPVFKKGIQVRLNVMVCMDDNSLKEVAWYTEDAEFKQEFSFATGIGAAGRAVKAELPIYVPAVRYAHGIRIEAETYRLEDRVFLHIREEPFKSLLCVPLLLNNRIYGVLNIDSPRQNPFSRFDIRVARVAATMVAAVLDRIANSL